MAIPLNAPAVSLASITPSDTVPFPVACRSIYVGVSGDISIIATNDSVAVVLKNVPVGVLPVCAKQVNATSTTASQLIALI